MRGLLADLSARSIAGAIVLAGVVAWALVLTGEWPSKPLLIGASIGGALSPSFWGLFRKLRNSQRAGRRGVGRGLKSLPGAAPKSFGSSLAGGERGADHE